MINTQSGPKVTVHGSKVAGYGPKVTRRVKLQYLSQYVVQNIAFIDNSLDLKSSNSLPSLLVQSWSLFCWATLSKFSCIIIGSGCPDHGVSRTVVMCSNLFFRLNGLMCQWLYSPYMVCMSDVFVVLACRVLLDGGKDTIRSFFGSLAMKPRRETQNISADVLNLHQYIPIVGIHTFISVFSLLFTSTTVSHSFFLVFFPWSFNSLILYTFLFWILFSEQLVSKNFLREVSSIAIAVSRSSLFQILNPW